MTLAILAFIIGQWLAVEGADLGPLFNAGVCAAILAFVLFRLEPRLRGIEKSNDRMTRALLVMMMGLRHLDEHHKEQAQRILGETEESEGG